MRACAGVDVIAKEVDGLRHAVASELLLDEAASPGLVLEELGQLGRQLGDRADELGRINGHQRRFGVRRWLPWCSACAACAHAPCMAPPAAE